MPRATDHLLDPDLAAGAVDRGSRWPTPATAATAARACVLGCTTLLLPLGAAAQDAPSERGPDGAGSRIVEAPTRTVAVLGASVSSGFVDFLTGTGNLERNQTVPMWNALQELWPTGVRVRSRSVMEMFRDPLRLGERQVERALADEPDLVVAIDFLFWFGYGYVGFEKTSDGTRVEVPAERLTLQAKGLALLERLRAPIIVGDYPDMTGAHPRMLHELQIPDHVTLAKLNENLHAWAEKRGNVRVFPLSRFVADAKREGLLVTLDGREVRLPPAALLQSDMLHATVLGMGVLTLRLRDPIVALVPEGSSLMPPALTLPQLVRRLGGEHQLEAALETVRARASKESAAPVER